MKIYIVKILILCFGIIVLSGCGSKMASSNDGDNLPLRFKGCVAETNMFNQQWKQKESALFVWERQPTQDNQYLSLETYFRTSIYYPDIRHQFRIVSVFREYTKKVDLNKYADTLSSLQSPKVVSFNLNLFKIGKQMAYFCGEEKDISSFICYIQSGFNYHASFVSISGTLSPNPTEIENIVNPLLKNVDICVSKLEK